MERAATIHKALSFQEKNNDLFRFKQTTAKYFFHWPLFVIGIIISIGVSMVYLKLKEPTYQIRATLLIQDNNKSPDQNSALREIDLITSKKLIDNEIEVLKSNQLIADVVQGLKLWVVYTTENNFSDEDLYGRSPVNFSFVSSPANFQPVEMSIVINDEHSFTLKSGSNDNKLLLFNHPYTDSFGVWKLERTEKLLDYKGARIKINVKDPEMVTLEYQQKIDASLPNKLTTAISLNIQDPIALRGKDILNSLILAYESSGRKEQEVETKNILAFLDQRIAFLSGDLNEAEAGIEGFKRGKGLTDIASDSKISLENLQANDSQLNEVNVQLTVIDGIDKYINSPQNLAKSTSTLGISDPALSRLIEKLSELQLQRERLLATTPETNPDFDPINRQILTTRAAIKENVNNIKQSLQRTREKLQTFNKKFESSIKDIPSQERQFISIKRQQSTKENLYTYLLQKREELSVKYASALANGRVVDQAYVASANAPAMHQILAVALFLGILVPIGLIYTREILGNKVMELKDITDSIELPVLNEFQYDNPHNSFLVNESATNAISEQFRTLRIKLDNLSKDRTSGSVTLLTSSISGEGKSFISKNMSLAFAYSNKKTLLLEMDLRKPQIHELFNIDKNHVGLTDFLNNTASLENIVQKSCFLPNLDIITSGTSVVNPSELLSKKELGELLDTLRRRYDHVVMDSPPVHLVPEAMMLSKLSDFTLYIIRQGFTGKDELEFIRELVDQQQLSNVKIIFNGIDKNKYGYGYAYQTDYYTDQRKDRRRSSILKDLSYRF
jgi:capsular exopolysaccharide synthesis family protein